jgi:uncharacterized membrane protein HdeD (DUF308 family)
LPHLVSDRVIELIAGVATQSTKSKPPELHRLSLQRVDADAVSVDRRIGATTVGIASVVAGTAFFLYGVIFVLDAVSIFGLLLVVGGGVSIASAVKTRGRLSPSIAAILSLLLLAFIGLVFWALATQTR